MEIKISNVFTKKHRGETAIALAGKILGTGKDALIALAEAKKKDPAIEDKVFTIFTIHSDEIIIA